MDLIIIVIASLLMVPLVMFTEGPVRMFLACFFVFIFPGYTFLAALFTRRTSLDNLTRLALTLGISIALVTLLLLGLNFTPWGIRTFSSLYVLLAFTCIMAAIAWWRRRQISEAERFAPRVNLNWLDRLSAFRRQSRLDRILNIILVIVVIGVIGSAAYVVIKPQDNDKFTEFYLLNLQGKAENYPKNLALGQTASVLVGIVNHEYATIDYRVEIAINGEVVDQIAPLTLKQEQKWEQPVNFTPGRAGPDQQVEFRLYMQDVLTDQTLHLWVNVAD